MFNPLENVVGDACPGVRYPKLDSWRAATVLDQGHGGAPYVASMRVGVLDELHRGRFEQFDLP
jgi:hypothetical protein